MSVEAVDQIDVPEDAWVDWDAASQKFITAGEKFPDGTTAKVKSVVTFPADLYDTVKWHDGSSISSADFVMAMIIFFDRAKPESAVYDEAAVPGLAGKSIKVNAVSEAAKKMAESAGAKIEVIVEKSKVLVKPAKK